MRLKLALICGVALASANAMACYTVYDSGGRMVYRGMETPVDMSQPLHRSLGQRLPGAHMVFDDATNCAPVAMTRAMRTATPGGTSPLLTDRQTAARQHLPHAPVAGNLVVVPAPAAAALATVPAVTVVPSVGTAPPVSTAAMGAGAARSPAVITELRDGSTVV
ncbi:MAG: hypothetical protein EOO24_54940, partial [Comamonadaceae bacterium]